MDHILEKTLNESRALLLGLLQGCIFSEYAKDDCPLLQLRKELSLTEKYNFVMEQSEKVIKSILAQHEECIAKKALASMQQD